MSGFQTHRKKGQFLGFTHLRLGREIEKFIIRQPPMGEKDDYDSENSWISDGRWVGFQVQTIKITKKRSQYFMKKLEEKCSGAATSSAIALACHKSTSVLGLCHPGLILQ